MHLIKIDHINEFENQMTQKSSESHPVMKLVISIKKQRILVYPQTFLPEQRIGPNEFHIN